MDHITDKLPRLAARRIPVLLVGGDMKMMRRKIPGSRLIVLSPATHFANRDQPAAWNDAVLGFLARVDRAARGHRGPRA